MKLIPLYVTVGWFIIYGAYLRFQCLDCTDARLLIDNWQMYLFNIGLIALSFLIGKGIK